MDTRENAFQFNFLPLQMRELAISKSQSSCKKIKIQNRAEYAKMDTGNGRHKEKRKKFAECESPKSKFKII